MDSFAAGILDGKPISPDLDDAVKTHELIFAADRSAETGQPVKLPLER
jgi:predicted dehydrogenase